jgi:cephalosporin-C deacetylase
MPRWDLTLEELQSYAPPVAEPDGFDAFWAQNLAQTRQHDLGARFIPAATELSAIRTLDVTFSGYGGHPIRAWMHLPADVPAGTRLPGVVQFQGYGGGRGLAHEHVLWALAGYAQLVMDNRGQGSGWTAGDTADPVGSGPSQPGFMTRGIDDARAHYYSRLFADAVRAVEALRSHEAVDPGRVAITGGSQGGAMALAVAALVPDVRGALIDVPFLCHIARGVELAETNPYAEVTRYLRIHRNHEQVLATLSHFDGVAFARRARIPALFSVGLMDTVCPPSTVYAAYNAYAGPKEIAVYHENDHEGGGSVHEVRQLRWLRELLER